MASDICATREETQLAGVAKEVGHLLSLALGRGNYRCRASYAVPGRTISDSSSVVEVARELVR